MVKTNEMHSKHLPKWQRNLVGVSSFFLTAGVALLLTWPCLFDQIIKQGLALSPSSFAFKLWQKNPMPLYLDFYLYNWTNPHDIHNASIKPRFVEIGPYRFEETKLKVNITWNDNGTVSFNHMKTWVFRREDSVGDLDMNITTLNPVTVSASYAARAWGFWMKKGLQFGFTQLNAKVHVTQTVGELLFYGYKDPFVTLGNYFPSRNSPNFDKFGWFYMRNNSFTAEGHYNMDTRPDQMGVLHRWNYEAQTQSYGKSCSSIEGSAGELYPRQPGKQKISFFSSDLCRDVPLDFDQEDEIKGFTGYKFAASTSLLDNGTLLPENKCYCNGECIPSGVMNVSLCKYGSPGFVSMPHFYKADPSYRMAVEGMRPEKEKHDFYIVLEPTTGIPLSVAARLQLNLLLQPVKYVTLFENVPKVFFPILWFEQVVRLPDSLCFLFTILLNVPLILQGLGYIFVVVSSSVITSILYTPFTKMFRFRSSRNLTYITEADPLNLIIHDPEKPRDEKYMLL